MKPELEGRYSLDDETNDWQLSTWLHQHPKSWTQEPILEFFNKLTKHPRPARGEGSEIVWTPLADESGLQAVGVAWVVDADKHMIRVVDVSDRHGELRSVE